MKACHNLIPIKLQRAGVSRMLPFFKMSTKSRYLVTNGNKPGHPKAGEVYGTVHQLHDHWRATLGVPASESWGFVREEHGAIYAVRSGYRTRQAAVDALVGTHLNPYDNINAERYNLSKS